jgi:hypothetical protein
VINHWEDMITDWECILCRESHPLTDAASWLVNDNDEYALAVCLSCESAWNRMSNSSQVKVVKDYLEIMEKVNE